MFIVHPSIMVEYVLRTYSDFLKFASLKSLFTVRSNLFILRFKQLNHRVDVLDIIKFYIQVLIENILRF